MKKTGFISSLVCVLFGTTTLTLTEFLVKAGRIAFNAVARGSYSPIECEMNFVFVNFIAVLLIISGIVGMFCFALIKTKD